MPKRGLMAFFEENSNWEIDDVCRVFLVNELVAI